MFSLSCLNILAGMIILLKQSSQGDLHLGHFLTWERPLDTSSGISPRYLSATSSQLNISITQLELSSLTRLKAQGDPEKFKSEIAFLLFLTGGCTEGDRVFGLSMIWVHPYQSRAPTMEEAVKQLTPLPSTGPDHPYTLVWLNGDACHAPLPKEGHLSIQVMESTSNVTCRRVS